MQIKCIVKQFLKNNTVVTAKVGKSTFLRNVFWNLLKCSHTYITEEICEK